MKKRLQGAGAGGRDVDDSFGFSAFGWAAVCTDESVGPGLPAAGAAAGRGEGGVGRGGAAAILGGAFCAEAREMALVNCSWIALICSVTFALSRATCSRLALSCSESPATPRVSCSWLAFNCKLRFAFSRAISSRPALSCSISLPTLTRSREIDWSNGVNSGDTAAVDAVWTRGAGCDGAVFAASPDDPNQMTAATPMPAASRMPVKPRSAHPPSKFRLPEMAGRNLLMLTVGGSEG